MERRARLYDDKRGVYCLPRSRWKRYSDFLKWLVLYGPHYALYLERRG